MQTVFITAISVAKLKKTFVVYDVFLAEKLVYKGVARYGNIFTLNGMLDNPELNDSDQLMIQISGEYDNQKDADNALYWWLCENPMPYYNKIKSVRHRKAVQCLDTGHVWPNVRLACAERGLSYSQLLNHLKRQAGFKSVKGRVYKFV